MAMEPSSPLSARPRGVVRAVAGAADRLRALIGRVDERIADAGSRARQPRRCADFDALTPRLAEVLEEAETGLRRRDEQQVVVSSSPRNNPALQLNAPLRRGLRLPTYA